MNQITYEKLQYNELKEIVKSYCVSGLGRQLIDKLTPSSVINAVKNRLHETTEAVAILNTNSRVPFLGVTNIEQIVQALEKGIILEPSDLLHASDFLRGCRQVKKYMLDKQEFAPVLASYAHSMTEFSSVEEEINFAIKGNRIDSSASRELKRIRQHMHAVEAKIEERLNKFLKSNTNKKYIQEAFISRKDGRYTIPIKAAYKHHVEGAIIDVSAKGSTVFIEPQSVTKLNAEFAACQAEEAMEEYQILAALSGLLLENIAEIKINMELISQYDMVFAKGKFSKQIDGIEPKLNDYGFIQLVEARHPLLSGHVVPLNFEVGKDFRSLIITGPNAGGKTVVLKTIGLLTLAAMSGFHISAAKGTEISLFERVFVDIGDNQSIENALSTFSSHMQNISDIMRSANNHTLLLFDEIGSGTEPNEGAALAIAILEEFYQMGCLTVATTHYGEIKRFSEMHPDFMNAAMRFDSDTLEPLYQLLLGKAGESNALWIAKKMNLHERALQKAEDYIANKDYELTMVSENKIRKPKLPNKKPKYYDQYEKGDRVKLLEHNEVGIVYQGIDYEHHVVVFCQQEFMRVHVKRIALEMQAKDLYPAGYDLETLFVDHQTRKMQHDLERGSKKALREIAKDIRKKRD
ncbi:endonuclease MutS2 [Gracilibacillus alcaliphilus]|uniref:endonuclease MutS2 n=1 Tax=Gracilibacillus alcaliphilus TaxID=1401441 RepID=UPI00195E84AE|nr:endonuclease MutS2 [Gracilibacillus alcaliphilus]MBM7676194.1 dsDNA-specific endonuclease/ATPase MutS2 [Gracilibacillus alcaliphilus]